jgi:hypothetical protein
MTREEKIDTFQIKRNSTWNELSALKQQVLKAPSCSESRSVLNVPVLNLYLSTSAGRRDEGVQPVRSPVQHVRPCGQRRRQEVGDGTPQDGRGDRSR